MKPIAIKELQEALSILTFQAGNLNPQNIEEVREDMRRAVAHINGAIFSETPQVSKKFDIWKMAADDETRPVMCGVFHKNGYKVASDSYVLVAAKEAYGEELEGHILDKTGRDIIGKYPNFEALKPKEDEGESFHIDTEKVYDLIKQQKAEKKAAGKWGQARPAYVKVGGSFFRAEKLAKLATFMDAYGATEIRIISSTRAAAIFAPDGSWAIIMPVNNLKFKREDGYISHDTPSGVVWDEHRDGILAYEAA